jgi:hypothetical protein
MVFYQNNIMQVSFPLISDEILFTKKPVKGEKRVVLVEQLNLTNVLLTNLMNQASILNQMHEVYFKISDKYSVLLPNNYKTWCTEHFQYIQNKIASESNKYVMHRKMYRALLQLQQRLQNDKQFLQMDFYHQYHLLKNSKKKIKFTKEDRTIMGMSK